VQLATTTLMLGAMGLLNRIDTPGRRSRGGPETLVFLFVILFVVASPMILMAGRAALANPWAAAGLGLLTPLPAFVGEVQGDPWLYGLAFFGWEIPFLVVTPVAQLLIAFLCFHVMLRQLVSPLRPPLSRALAYGLLVLLDLLTAGLLADSGPQALSLATRATVFWLLHLCFSLVLVLAVTPWREILISWVWRFRGQRFWLLDLWLGDRSQNILVLLTFAVLGLVNLALLVLLPAARTDGAEAFATVATVLIWTTVTTPVMLVTYGAWHQWVIYLAGRSGATLAMLVIVAAVAAPHLAGHYYDLEWLMSLSPSFHFGNWLTASPSRPVPMLAIHGLALILVWSLLRRRLRRMGEIVDQKLRWMGAI
jgi:hypothetical protein